MNISQLIQRWQVLNTLSGLLPSEHRGLRLNADTDEIEVILRTTTAWDKIQKLIDSQGMTEKRTIVEGRPGRLVHREVRAKDLLGAVVFVSILEGED